MTHLALVLASLLAAAAGNAPAVTPPAVKAATTTPNVTVVVERMQRRYDEAKDFRARFKQTYTRAASGRASTSAGEVLIKKPGNMRWNYTSPEPKMLLSNGQTLWSYEPEIRQAVKQDLKGSQLPAALSFLMGRGKLTSEFDVKLAPEVPYGGAGHHKLSLKPKQQQSTYQAIYFIVDAQDHLVRESVLIDAQGNVNHFVFTDLAVNTKIADSTFKWSPPSGVRVVDTGKMAKGS